MTDEPKRRVLWADDEIDLLRPHIKFLETKGYAVTGVPSGEDALARLRQEPYDVVLLDEMMPGMGGLETLVAIKGVSPALPVIMVTKNEEEALMEEAIGKRITDYLIKPVNPSQVFLACKRVLDAQKLQDSQLTRDYVTQQQRWQSLPTRQLSWAQWVELAVELARWDVTLDASSEEGLKQAHGDFRRSVNVEFGRFIEAHYGHWVHRDLPQRPPLSVDVVPARVAPLLREGKRVVFVVVDCMRLDQWFAIEGMVADLFEVDCGYYCSILPTATPYSRNAIFSGLLPADLAIRHPQYWQEVSGDERSKNRHEHQLLDLQLQRLHLAPRSSKYVKIYNVEEANQTRRQIGSFEGIPLVSLVFNFVDILAHGRAESEILQELAPDEAAFRAVMKTWFAHSALYESLRALSAQDCRVVLTTDHGAVLGRRAALVYGNRETSTNLRYKFGTNLNCDTKHAVLLRRPGDFRLPAEGVNKNYLLAREDYYFVYPTRFHDYERQYRGSFQHGGISLEEMVLPLATLTPRAR